MEAVSSRSEVGVQEGERGRKGGLGRCDACPPGPPGLGPAAWLPARAVSPGSGSTWEAPGDRGRPSALSPTRGWMQQTCNKLQHVQLGCY